MSFSGSISCFVLCALTYTLLNQEGAQLPPPVVGTVSLNSLADKLEILPGDQITKINAFPTQNWFEVEGLLANQPGTEKELALQRNGQIQTKRITFKKDEMPVSYFQLPPVITLTLRDSIFTKRGLVTGDRVREIKFPDSKIISPKSYYHFISALMNARARNTKTLLLTFENSSKQITFNQLDLPPPASSTYREYSKLLGIRDSELTISSVRDPGITTLKAGDLLVEWNNQKIETLEELNILLSMPNQTKVNVTVIRNFQRISTSIDGQPLIFMAEPQFDGFKNPQANDWNKSFSMSLDQIQQKFHDLAKTVSILSVGSYKTEWKDHPYVQSHDYLLFSFAEISFLAGIANIFFGFLNFLFFRKKKA